MKIQNIFILLGISESSFYRFTLPPGAEIECKLALNLNTYTVGWDEGKIFYDHKYETLFEA